MRWAKGESGNPTGKPKGPTKPRVVRPKGPNRLAAGRRKRNRARNAAKKKAATSPPRAVT